MPNWCFNFAQFGGSAETLTKLENDLRVSYESTREGFTLPCCIQEDTGKPEEGYFFEGYTDLEQLSNGYLTFHFSTKWGPCNKDVASICKSYGVTCEVEYSESSNNVFGKAVISPDGDIMNVELDNEDIELAVPDDEEDPTYYTYNGIQYEVQDEAFEAILEGKIKRLGGGHG